MEIQIYNPSQGQPLPAIQWNYPEVRKWVEDGLESYKGRVYTDENIVQAKKDRANLNKLADAIDSKRKEMKALYLHPYEEFEAQAKELTAMVKTKADEIAAQVKAYDDFRRQEKRVEVEKLYDAMIGDLAGLVPYDRLHDPKWLNVTTSMTTVTAELGGKIDRITAGMSSIDKLDMEPDVAQQVKDVFLKKFDLAAALAEKDRIEKQREELARYKAAQDDRRVLDASDPHCFEKARPGDVIRFGGHGCETGGEKYTHSDAEKPPVTRYSDGNTAPEIHTVTFRIRVTADKLKVLGDFMRANGIRPERV